MRKHSKTDVRYWRQRVFKPLYSRGGAAVEAQNWAVEIQHGGQRRRWSLKTTNRDTAAASAKEMYLFIQVNGWEQAAAKYKPEPVKPNKFDITIGEFLAELRAKADAKPKTLQAYARAFRTMVADIAGLPSGG
jgi:hypothetical protein